MISTEVYLLRDCIVDVGSHAAVSYVKLIHQKRNKGNYTGVGGDKMQPCIFTRGVECEEGAERGMRDPLQLPASFTDTQT